jgi:ribosome biogenesis GTPase
LAARGLVPGRVVRTSRGSVLIATEAGVLRAKISASLTKSAEGAEQLPVVGDWVGARVPDGADAPLVEAVMPRTSAITRSDPGRTSEVQVLAANIDTVFIVHPIAEAPNVRRIERELSVAWDSGAVPVVVLTKRDLSSDADGARLAVEAVAPGTDVLVTNARAGEGIAPMLDYIADHRTAVLVGPSGAGKSTLLNALAGEELQATREVRVNDGRGRHTTVSRQLFRVPRGGLLIDTPGLRAFGLTGSEEGIASAFPDVEELANGCRFRDCTHHDEPGCAVTAAVESGALPGERLASFHKLMGEAQDATAKTEVRVRAQEVRSSKAHKAAKDDYKSSDRR